MDEHVFNENVKENYPSSYHSSLSENFQKKNSVMIFIKLNTITGTLIVQIEVI
ncbi:hypothetical protein JZO84_14165 [Enterococcus plantarum]|nr:hypothetical protein [Enterococcus plantarum]